MAAVVISGPPDALLSFHAIALAKHYGKKRVVEHWRPGQPMPADALLLTREASPGAIPAAAALRAIGIPETAWQQLAFQDFGGCPRRMAIEIARQRAEIVRLQAALRCRTRQRDAARRLTTPPAGQLGSPAWKPRNF